MQTNTDNKDPISEPAQLQDNKEPENIIKIQLEAPGSNPTIKEDQQNQKQITKKISSKDNWKGEIPKGA